MSIGPVPYYVTVMYFILDEDWSRAFRLPHQFTQVEDGQKKDYKDGWTTNNFFYFVQ